MARRNYDGVVEEAKREVADARMKIVELYSSRIRDIYDKLNEKEQDTISYELESLIKYLDVPLPQSKHKVEFNGEIAKKIRESKGLTRVDLAKQLGVEGSKARDPLHQCSSTIKEYENGRKIPVKGMVAVKYIAWLRENDYPLISILLG